MNVIQALKTIPDPRSRRGRQYPLFGLLAIVLLAAMHGERSLRGMWLWARARQDDLLTHPALGLRAVRRIPSLATFWYAVRKRPLLWVMLAAWFSVGTLFMLVGYRVSMVDKQLFYIVPAICLCWAIYAERFWRRGWWGKALVATIYTFTLATALDLWVIRILRSPVV